MATELDARPALVIELCPQGNASLALYGSDYETAPGIRTYDLLHGVDLVGEPSVGKDNIELISATLELSDIDNSQTDTVTANFQKNVRRFAATNRWSWIFIDTPPSLGALQIAALSAADYAVIPVGLDRFSMQGLGKLLDTFALVQEEYNPDLTILGILPNKVNASRKEQISALKEIVTAFDDMILRTPIRDRSPIADAIDRGVPVWKNIRSGNARTSALEMRTVMIDILRRAR
jgi:chromosome partitioning protein